MKPGRAKIPNGLKVISGTDQPCRMAPPSKPIEPGSETVKRPSYLKGEARKKWDLIAPILEKRGRLDVAHLDVVISYCLLAGRQIELAKKSELLSSTDRMELRRIGESLGLVQAEGDGPYKPKKNQFTRNGKPPSP